MLTVVKHILADHLSQVIPLEPEEIISKLESPKNSEHGHLAFPTFVLAKALKKPPPVIAQDLADQLQKIKHESLDSINPVSGFLNFKFKTQFLQKNIIEGVLENKNLGKSHRGAGKKVVIDFSSPNVAKPMSIGHLRATVIGQAICNLSRSQGYEVVGLNHLGDWGTQFGKLAWAYEEWGQEYDFENDGFESLYALYVRFHEEAEKRPEINMCGAGAFKKLEAGDEGVTKLWKWFVEISLKEYSKMWGLLGVEHELVKGESYYNEMLKPTENLLEEKGLLVENQGAMVVEMEDPKIPPCLIRKSDGASLYATRDIASAIYRVEELGADLSLYVVGMEQTLHFRQVFEVLKKMDFSWWKNCHHISFGMYTFKEMGRMSSRKGQIIRLDEVVTKAINLVRETIEKKNPDLTHKDEVAQQVGVGAIIFNDLVNDRVKNVDFNWEQVLDFEGNSGPYVQYCNVRCESLLRKSGLNIDTILFDVELATQEESELMWELLAFENVLENAFDNFKPHLVATYLLDLCRCFSTFYGKHKVLQSEPGILESRMALVKATQTIIQEGLKILNISAPKEM